MTASSTETSSIHKATSHSSKDSLEAFLQKLKSEYRVPLPLKCAVERYQEWGLSNPRATPAAKERQIKELHSLYRLDDHGDMGRYTLYRRTYFANASAEVADVFDRLLAAMFRNPTQRPTHMVELSELQDWRWLDREGVNDFTETVFGIHPALRALAEAMKETDRSGDLRGVRR